MAGKRKVAISRNQTFRGPLLKKENVAIARSIPRFSRNVTELGCWFNG